MDNKKIKEICTKRLGRWQKKLEEKHATPVLLMGVGHDHNSGKLVVCCNEDCSDAQLSLWLAGALGEIKFGTHIRY